MPAGKPPSSRPAPNALTSSEPMLAVTASSARMVVSDGEIAPNPTDTKTRAISAAQY